MRLRRQRLASVWSIWPLLLTFAIGGVRNVAGAEAPETGASVVGMEDEEVCLLLKVRCWEKDLSFLLDTGTAMTAFDRHFESDLGPVVASSHMITPTNGIPAIHIYGAPEMHVGEAPARLDRVTTADLSFFSKLIGAPCDGVLGLDYLKQSGLTIDFGNKTGTFGDTMGKTSTANALRVPMTLLNTGQFEVIATINGSVPLHLVIDTGDSSTVSLNPKDWSAVMDCAASPSMTEIEMSTANGHVATTFLARLNELQIGPASVRNVLCARTPNPNAPSTLGLNFFRQYLVGFDFARREIALSARKSGEEPEEADMSGLHLIRSGKATIVYSVNSQSPAAQAGIAPGDELVGVDGKGASDLKIFQIRRLLRSGDGKEIALRWSHSGELSESTIRLKRQL